jgi:hypothetical protein
MENIYELFYKLIENPRCIKYYEDLEKYYIDNKEKQILYKEIKEKIKNENSNSHTSQE